jgi:hypothetical protein
MFGASTALLGSAAFVLACSLGLAMVFPRWTKAAGGLSAFRRLSQDPQACGLGLLRVNWWDTGGYTYLHRAIPIFVFCDLKEAASAAPQYNRIVAPLSEAAAPPGYTLVRCESGICVYRREGSCQPGSSQFEINAYLNAKGQ